MPYPTKIEYREKVKIKIYIEEDYRWSQCKSIGKDQKSGQKFIEVTKSEEKKSK